VAVRPKLSGGAVLDLHIHDLDLLSWLLGKPAQVSAAGVKTSRRAGQRVTTLIATPAATSFAEGSLDSLRASPSRWG